MTTRVTSKMRKVAEKNIASMQGSVDFIRVSPGSAPAYLAQWEARLEAAYVYAESLGMSVR